MSQKEHIFVFLSPSIGNMHANSIPESFPTYRVLASKFDSLAPTCMKIPYIFQKHDNMPWYPNFSVEEYDVKRLQNTFQSISTSKRLQLYHARFSQSF